MDTGQHENLPPGLASAAPRSLVVERGQTYNPRTARKDYSPPRTPHKEQKRRIQAPTSRAKIRTVPRSYRTLTESKVLTLDQVWADIATCEKFLAREPRERTSKVSGAGRSIKTLSAQDDYDSDSESDSDSEWDEINEIISAFLSYRTWRAKSRGYHTPAPGDLTSNSSPREEEKPRGQIGWKERKNLALYNLQQETFSDIFRLMVHAPGTPAVQFLSDVQKLMAVHQVMLTTDYARRTVSKLGNEFLWDSVQTDLRSFLKDNPETDIVTFSLLRRFIETWEANHPHQRQTYSKDLSQHSPPHRSDKRFSRQLADVPRDDRIDALSQDGSSPHTPHRDKEHSLSRRWTAKDKAERRAEILRFEIRREAAWELAVAETPGNLNSRSTRGEEKPRSRDATSTRTRTSTDDQRWLQTRNLSEHQDYQEFTEYSDVLYNDYLVPLRSRFAHTTRATNPGITSVVIGFEDDSPPKPKDTGFATVPRTTPGRINTSHRVSTGTILTIGPGTRTGPGAKTREAPAGTTRSNCTSTSPRTKDTPRRESEPNTLGTHTSTSTPDTSAIGTTRICTREISGTRISTNTLHTRTQSHGTRTVPVPTHTVSMDTTRTSTVQDAPAQVRKTAQPSRTSARTKRNPACTVVATTGRTVSATIIRTRTSTRSGRFSREDAPASTEASTNTSAKEKSGTRFGTTAAHTRTQFPGSQQAHGIRSVPDPKPSAAASSADDTVQEPPVPPKPPDLFQRQAAPHNDYG